jgi:hypothetical protein
MNLLKHSLRRHLSFSVYKMADAFVIPTLSCSSRSVVHCEHALAPHFNLSNVFKYSRKPAQIVGEGEEGQKQADNTLLNKITLDVSPNYDEFLQYIRTASKIGMTYINVTSDDYFVLAKIIEQEKTFPNIVVTVENAKLTEEELNDIYENINHPMYIGMNMKNAQNFAETDTETSLRRYLKEMFKYSSQIKMVEIDFPVLKRLCDNMDPNKEKPTKKHATLKTLVDFMLLSEFKGFLDITISDKTHNHSPEADAELGSYLKQLDEFLLQKGFAVNEFNKEEIFQIVHNIKPDNDQLLIGASY